MVFQADYRIYLLWCVRCGGDCDCCVIRVSDGMNSLKKTEQKNSKIVLILVLLQFASKLNNFEYNSS